MTRFLWALLLLAGGCPRADEGQTWTTDQRWGGCGGVYMRASPGELWVEVEKSDLNVSGQPTHLRAILFGPDRRVIEEKTLPDDGRGKGSGPGPVQRLRLSTTVPRTGVYGLNITVSTDRYGENVAWAFKTNCPHYMVETSRGHKDAPHEEPLVLLNPDAPGDVCFLPRQGECAIDVTNLPPGCPALTLYDSQDKQVAEMPVSAQGEAFARFESGSVTPEAPWRLRFPRFKGTVNIDGVTRWTEREDYANLSLWAPQRESWFAFAPYRWLLTPYSQIVYAQPGTEGTVVFQVHNNAPVAANVSLALEFPDEAWPLELSVQEVTVGAHQGGDVALRYRVPSEGDRWLCHVRATAAANPSFSTYSTIELRRGAAPAAEPLAMPIVLKPYQHENEQFGYRPDYPLSAEVYFDVENRPFVISETAAAVGRNGAWTHTPFPPGFVPSSTKVTFDAQNGVYIVGEKDDAITLLYSSDGGGAFTSYSVPGTGRCDIEQFSGHNVPEGPPPFVRFTLTERDPELFWRRLNDLDLFLPQKDEAGAITIPAPVPVSRKCIGYSGHSGMPSTLVSRGARVHVVWGEATDPEADAPGVPTYAATYDRDSATLSAPALIGYGPPANDVHNTPCITIDSQGYLHVLVGTHGRTFRYARSLEANTAAGGWTEAEDIGPGLRQTYVGMVCGKNDVLHLVFRLWHTDTQYFPAGHYASLAYMSKRSGEPWSEPRPLVVPPFSEYSVFYHRLTIDRQSRLFLSYDYWSTFWFYRTDHSGTRRALLTSPDQGATWKLADASDFIQ